MKILFIVVKRLLGQTSFSQRCRSYYRNAIIECHSLVIVFLLPLLEQYLEFKRVIYRFLERRTDWFICMNASMSTDF